MTGGIFAILDDIAMLLDDAAMVTKASIKQTAPILGDDLAVNAEKAAGFHASRELPVLWAITKGSLINKLIILPIAFILSAIAPWLISPILILGGLYLAFEGAEKVHEFILFKLFKKAQAENKVVMSEEAKIKSAIMTDFVLSIEIIVIALGTVMEESFQVQIIAVSIVALLATVGVYGIVAFIVRLDDMGFHLIKNSSDGGLKAKLGELLVASLPKVVKFLTVIGTIAMLLVAGGILNHHIPFFHHFYVDNLSLLPTLVYEMFLGFITGYILFMLAEPVLHQLSTWKLHGKNKTDEK